MDPAPSDAPLAPSDARPAVRDDIFDALSHARRRFVLQYLRASSGPVTVDELVAELDTREDDPTASHSRERVAVSLQHVHLPKLADTGLVEYDEQWRLVELADGVDELQSVLRAVADHEAQ